MSASFSLSVPFLGSWQGQPSSAGDNVTNIWLPSFRISQLWAHTELQRSWSSLSSFAIMVTFRSTFPHCLCSTSQEAAVSRLLLQLDEFIYFVFKCRTYLNSTASWCSSQFLSVSYCSVALPHPCPRSSLASCTVELIWLKNNPANSKMINSQGWITDCSPNALSVTQSHGSRPHADAALGAQWWHRRGRCLQGSTRVVPFRWTWMSHPQKLSFFFSTKSPLVRHSSQVTYNNQCHWLSLFWKWHCRLVQSYTWQ